MNYLKISVILALASFLFIAQSCKEDDENEIPENTHEDAYADIIVKKTGMGYMAMFFAGGIDIETQGSTVTTPDGSEYELTEYWAGAGKVRNDDYPVQDEYLPTGDYTFNLKFTDGYEKEIIDKVAGNDLDLLTGLTVTHEEGSDEISVSWNEVSGCDLYCIKLTELNMAETMPLFKTAMMPTSQFSYTFDTSTSSAPGWMRNPDELERGTEYWLVVAAKKVEEGAEVSGSSQDFDINSVAKTKIVW